MPLVVKADRMHTVAIEHFGFDTYVEATLFDCSNDELERRIFGNKVHYGKVRVPTLPGWNSTIAHVCGR